MNKEDIELEFKKQSKNKPGYCLCLPGTDLKDPLYNSLKIEIDPYNTETISPFLDVDEEERDNRIKHLLQFCHKKYDELAADRVIEYISKRFSIKIATLNRINSKITSNFKKEKQWL